MKLVGVSTKENDSRPSGFIVRYSTKYLRNLGYLLTTRQDFEALAVRLTSRYWTFTVVDDDRPIQLSWEFE